MTHTTSFSATATPESQTTHRAAWLRVLSLAEPKALSEAYQQLSSIPEYRVLRAPERGMAMVRARAGGTGGQFNLGEMSITRCAIALEGDVMGVAYVQGRGARHAEQAAVLDALLQREDWHDQVQDTVIAPLARAYDERVQKHARVAAQTQVEFFTMVRGED
jgi:alpha-D-ribose 1-methylphosphonate 5-triphosphate synthase subunit PhnG